MEFLKVSQALQKHFDQMTNRTDKLFEVEVDKDKLWELYLDSFLPGHNMLYRKRREYDCSCCRHFIRAIGNVVAIKDNKVISIWDCPIEDEKWQPVFKALSSYIKSHPVTNVFISKGHCIGTKVSREMLPSREILNWHHFYLTIPARFVNNSCYSVESFQSDYRAIKDVFKRSLEEISLDAIQTARELIASNTLYRGAEWKDALKTFENYKREYQNVAVEDRDNFVWEKSVTAGPVIGKIKNHSIGVLLINISEGMDLETAVKKYEDIVAPSNYKRSKPIFTKKMLEDAKKTIEQLGYMDSLGRRYARLDDITVNNILFSNKDAAKRISGGNGLFDKLESKADKKPIKFDRVEEVGIEKFVNDILPNARELQVYLENKHESNMVSLIAPMYSDAKSMFKWDNGFSWAYSGNMADSMLKERVKAAGGRVDGVLRFSIQWNDTNEYSGNDLDAHCIEPSGEEIYFAHARKPLKSGSGGQLDVDITYPSKDVPAVENITWNNKAKMLPGVYKFFVRQFANRGGRDGFRAEIEFDGQIYSFDYNKEVKQSENIHVAEVILDENGKFAIRELLPSSVLSKDMWGLTTNQFVPVSTVMFSPNYWDEQSGVGNKHVFFMLKNCVNPEQPNGMFNEYLKEDLMKHRKVFEALGAEARVEDCADQLSGVGFSTTKRAEVVVKVIGNTERIMKVRF